MFCSSWGIRRIFLEFVQMYELSLSNLMGCLKCLVVMRLGEFFELYCWRGLWDLLLLTELC